MIELTAICICDACGGNSPVIGQPFRVGLNDLTTEHDFAQRVRYSVLTGWVWTDQGLFCRECWPRAMEAMKKI